MNFQDALKKYAERLKRETERKSFLQQINDSSVQQNNEPMQLNENLEDDPAEVNRNRIMEIIKIIKQRMGESSTTNGTVSTTTTNFIATNSTTPSSDTGYRHSIGNVEENVNRNRIIEIIDNLFHRIGLSNQQIMCESSTKNDTASTTATNGSATDSITSILNRGFLNTVYEPTSGIRGERWPCGLSPIKKDDADDDIIGGNFPNYNAFSSLDKLLYQLNKPFGCVICIMEFSKKKSLKLHMQKNHEHKFPHECSVCGEGFEKEQEKRTHEKLSKFYYCDLCHKRFMHRKTSLIKHMRSHNLSGPGQ